tara:strand:+ start:327 stop:1703 length:1377 start_codon:yes stop_codon:yes gene_type:complete
MAEEFVQVPPDSGGKKLHHKKYNDGVADVYAPVVHVADRNDPTRQQTVAGDGSALTTFSTGNPLFDSYGRLEMTDHNLLSEYKFYDGPKAVTGRIQEDTIGGGTITYSTVTNGYVLQNGAALGDSAKITTHRHFPNRPGSATTAYFTFSCSDAGKTGLRRIGGILSYARTDGICVLLDGTDFMVRVDSTLNPSQVIQQADWNGDRLDGTGGDNNRSGATLDFTKSTVWWITYQFLGAGAVTVGTYVDGVPVVIHTFGHWAALDRPYMATTDLCGFFEIENYGSVGTTSEMTVFAAVMVSSGPDEMVKAPMSVGPLTKSLPDGVEVPFFSLRPAQTYQGVDNRQRYLFEMFSAITTAEPVVLTMYQNATLTGATYTESLLGLEWDTAATSFTGGHKFGSLLFSPTGNTTVDVSSLFNNMTDGLFRHADVTDTDVWTVCVQSLTGAATTVYAGSIVTEVS